MSVNEQVHQLGDRFSRLSGTKKFLLTLGIAGVVGAGVVLARMERRVPMEPVLTQVLDAGDLAQITARLSSKAIPFKTDGGKLLVPADKKIEVLADLFYEDLLPNSAEDGFDAMFKQMSFWDSGTKLDHMYIRGKELTLRSIIGHFPGVKKATVLIDPTSEQHIGGAVTPSALVDIQTRGNVKAVRRLATAAVNAVIGAQSNLSRDKVQVTIDGIPCRVAADDNDREPAELLEQRQQQEQAYVAKLRSQLAFIPDALISVSLDPSSAPPTSTSLATTQNASQLQANTAIAVGHEQAPVLTLSASVAVPRSYFVRIYRRGTSETAEPSDGLLQPIIDSELTHIRKLVKSCLAIRNDDDVTVESYYDLAPPAATSPTRSAAMPLAAFLTSHARESTIGAAVMLGLVAVSLVMRRKAAPSVVTTAQPMPASLLLAQHAHANEPDEALDAAPDARGDPQQYARLIQQWVTQER